MDNIYKISVKDNLLINNSKKIFLLFNHKDGKVTNYKLSNELRYRSQFMQFRLLEIVKQNNINTIKL